MTTTEETLLREEMYGAVQQPAFEGASTSYRNDIRGLLSGTPDTLAAREVALLQMRSAHAIRNNGYAKTAVTKYVTNLSALKVNWKTKAGKKHEKMQDLWDEFALNPNLDGYGTLDNTQSIWHYSDFYSGAAYTRLHIRRNGNTNKIPLKLEVIESEFHDIGYMGNGDGSVRNGIKFVDTKPSEYYFRKGIFDATWYGLENPHKLIAIPADEILHIFKRTSPGQWIGIPYLSSVLMSLYELDELVDATIAKQKAAQAIAWIIENTNPLAANAIGAPGYVADSTGVKNKLVFNATGGNVQYLNKGEKVTFYQSTDIGANLSGFIRSELQRICTSADIPYHQFTGDTTGLDFSSIRAIGIELRTRLEYIHHFYTIPLGLYPLALQFKRIASLYARSVATAIPSFQTPRWYGVDELKDAQSDLLEVQSGFATLQSKLDERHTTFEDIIADRERMRNELGLEHILNPSGGSLTNQNTNVQANSNSTGN